MSRLVDLENVSESIIWGIVTKRDSYDKISDKIVEYLYSIPVEQKYDIGEIVEKMVCAANSDGYVKLEEALEIVRDY